MSSFVRKATPFFEHIVIGLAFAAMGYFFFWTFNKITPFSILGMAALLFGGLKLLVGVVIYGGWILGLIFRPEYMKKKEEEEELEYAKKLAADAEPDGKKGWLQTNAPFVAKHWGTILELCVLFVGFIIIVITKNG
ncbi:MAG TPA: hypothetical protein VFE50_20445 [Cyclobacteriaceae bacterium]|nr:hypothetical protein [Cyclobacteriaceae bacterium]